MNCTCSFGIASKCPGLTGRISRNAETRSPRWTKLASASPLTMSQKGHPDIAQLTVGNGS
jgi:hypothetical protein